MQLLEQMIADGKGPKWAWLQLELLKLDQGDTQESIKYLGNVIRLDPKTGILKLFLLNNYISLKSL